jgi:hypothetical protein
MNKWLDKYAVLDEAHIPGLESDAAINEFHHKMDRPASEAASHANYSKKHHLQSAAHHYAGLKAAEASNNREAALEHGYKLAIHRAALGEDHMSPVSDEIKSLAQTNFTPKTYSYQGHPGDALLEQHLNTPKSVLALNINEYKSKFQALRKTALEILNKRQGK